MMNPFEVVNKLIGGPVWEKLLNLVELGTHIDNPYHNTDHMKLVIYHAMAAYVSEGGNLSSTTAIELAIAALFHDFNHSGGVESDENNINAALVVIEDSVEPLCKPLNLNMRHIYDMILCTRYDGPEKGFLLKPDTVAEKCLRDADLCMIYTYEGRDLLLGLFEELNPGKTLGLTSSIEEVNAFFNDTCKFLREAEYFTQYGKRMRDTQLNRALEQFRQRLELITNNTILRETL